MGSYFKIGLLFFCLGGLVFPLSTSAKSARDQYFTAEACYKQLIQDTKKQQYRDNWLRCIGKFKAVYLHSPSGSWASAALYMSASLYKELYYRSFKSSDKQEALDLFDRIVNRYPKSAYRSKAEAAISDFSRYSSNTTVSPPNTPSPQPPDTVDDHQTEALASKEDKVIEDNIEPDSSLDPQEDTSSQWATIKGLRYWSNPNYTRIVVDADNDVSYSHRLLQQDPSINKPQRLYVDILNGRLGENIETDIPINDNLLASARAGQYAPDTVRVVVDIKSFKTYKVFALKSPYRIVIDVWGKDSENITTTPSPVDTVKEDEKIAPSALARQLALGVKRIVIDPGHGGRDYGAPGGLKGVHEKHITLEISKRLAKKVHEKLGCEVILTRETDKYLTLEERTAIANTHNADLFISVHTNAAKDRRAYGIMTFILNLATDDESIRVAARENATSTKNISDLQTILSELMQNAKINESSRLASHVQKATCKHLEKKYSQINSKGVKQAPFYVLLGAQMPAVLVETSFISNNRECKRLKDPAYQDRLAEGILQGIQGYIKETNPTVFLIDQPTTDTKG